MTEPYVIHGRGKDQCPPNTFCLFADINFNVDGPRTSILVIPAGSTSNNFSEHGFNQSDDGVSSVVNGTNEENALFTKIDQGGHRFPVPAKSEIADLTKYKLPGSRTGTWNDQPQSALAYKEVVPVPVIDQPLADAKVENATQHVSGTAPGAVDKVEIYDELKLIGTVPVSNGQWTFTPSTDWSEGKHELAVLAVHGSAKSGRAYRNFYLVKPTATVQITTPKNGAHVDDSAHIEGHAFHAGAVELKDGDTALGTVPVTGDMWAYAHAEAWALGEHTVHATAVSGGIRSTEARTTFTVEKQNLNVTYQFSGSWSDTTSGVEEHVYSYNIVLTADTKSVERWRLGFKQLPAKAHLAKMFTDTFWGVIIKDGADGTVLLGSPPPEQGKHIIFAGKELHVQVQVAFPDKNSAHEKLYGLFAEDWGKSA
ncbi:peptidase inhibitor family I36 protein [Glycomyces tritici]|uniref:Peptidase inhibitor family I36 protein n=1 Tax=Glycomyces tritici TaxID=2665176 RepID=A0ABT7YWZ0_9ACTN|nr:peptidase inhibitor family I36 protein [Glycomyces tritici]MDN3243159.1 peptidase inhibitor family I36 protein [Glycomyces tritici]